MHVRTQTDGPTLAKLYKQQKLLMMNAFNVPFKSRTFFPTKHKVKDLAKQGVVAGLKMEEAM